MKIVSLLRWKVTHLGAKEHWGEKSVWKGMGGMFNTPIEQMYIMPRMSFQFHICGSGQLGRRFGKPEKGEEYIVQKDTVCGKKTAKEISPTVRINELVCTDYSVLGTLVEVMVAKQIYSVQSTSAIQLFRA